MSNRRTILFIIAGVLLVVVLISNFLPGGGAKPTPTPTTVPVVVAKHDIPPYTLLRVEDVRTAQVPANKVAVEGVFSGLREVAGLMTTTEVRAGNAVERSNVLVPDPSWLKGDMRIFSFYVSTARVLGGQLRSGHRIDLLVTRGKTEKRPAESLWLAYNLWVVGVQQASGADVGRPTAAVYNPTPTQKGEKASSSDLLPVNPRGAQGASNLVVVAADRETGRVIGDYLGAQQYDAWVYIIPAESGPRPTQIIHSKIDGVVFEDKDGSGEQEEDERGLDEVTVTLFDEGGVTLNTYKTDSGGKFYFEELTPGTYRLEVSVPANYTPTTSNRLTQKVGEGINYYLKFGLAQLGTPTATAEPPKPPTATPTMTPTPKPGEVVTPTPPPPGTATLHMSDRQDGAEITEFPKGVQEVWAVMTFSDCPKDMPYTIKAYFTGTGNEEHEVSSGTWAGGSGKKSVRVMPTKLTPSGSFEPGFYVSVLRTGSENAIRDLKLWSVSSSTTVTHKATPSPNMPVTGSDVERQR